MKSEKKYDSDEIRNYSSEHFEKTVEWLNDPYISEQFGLSYRVTLSSHENWVKSNPQVETLALYCDGLYVGNIVLSLNIRHRSAYLQIYIGEPSHRGLGKGKIFMVKALSHMFKTRDIHRVWLHVRESNLVAKKLYESLGFVSEGIERESVFCDGKFISQLRMSMLSSDFNTGTYENN